jgi:hypothetical protein
MISDTSLTIKIWVEIDLVCLRWPFFRTTRVLYLDCRSVSLYQPLKLSRVETWSVELIVSLFFRYIYYIDQRLPRFGCECWRFRALKYWMTATDNLRRSPPNQGNSKGLWANFHSMMNYLSHGRMGMSFDPSLRSYFVRKMCRMFETEISWCIID